MDDASLRDAFKKEASELLVNGFSDVDRFFRAALAELGYEMNADANELSKDGVALTEEEAEAVDARIEAGETPACRAFLQFREEWFEKQEQFEERMAAAGVDSQKLWHELKNAPQP